MFYSIFIRVEGRGFLRHVETSFFKIQKQNSPFLLQRHVKQSELIGKPGLNPNHNSIPMQKVFFLHIFARKQTFDRIFSLLETRLSPFES